MIGEYIKTADWKAEKHVPVIECPGQVHAGAPFVVTVAVGREIPHPNLGTISPGRRFTSFRKARPRRWKSRGPISRRMARRCGRHRRFPRRSPLRVRARCTRRPTAICTDCGRPSIR